MQVERNTTLVILVIAAISFVYSFIAYTSMVSALDSQARKFISAMTETYEENPMILMDRGNFTKEEQMEFYESLCDVEINANLTESDNAIFIYAKNCDREKFREISGNDLDYAKSTEVMRMSIMFGVMDMLNAQKDVIFENTDRESLGLMEKMYDTLSLLVFVSRSGFAYTTMVHIGKDCQPTSENNQTADMECINVIKKKKSRFGRKAFRKDRLEGFVQRCGKYFRDSGIAPGVVNINSACMRIRDNMETMMEKSMGSSVTEETRFFKALFFYMISRMDNNAANEAIDIVIENTNPQFAGRIEKIQASFL